MALKSVVAEPFFENVIRALRTLEAQRGELTLVLLNASSLHRQQWDVTIAARWIDSSSLLKAGAEISQFLKRELVDPRKQLGRVKVRSTSDLLVRSLTSELDIEELDTPYRVTGLELELFSMDEVVCLLSRPVRAVASDYKVSA